MKCIQVSGDADEGRRRDDGKIVKLNKFILVFSLLNINSILVNIILIDNKE